MASRRRSFSLIVLPLCSILSVSADVFLSIDCGSSVPSYKDENLIAWTGDGDYVKSGESRSVQSANNFSREASTLRVFTTGRKNCYQIDSVVRGRILLRAAFYYGNYDGKSSPPTFDLQFDGNHWATVETSSTEYYYHEVTYVMKRDSISVCVAQTNPGQHPFVSSIEVRGLESFMYHHIDDRYPLFLMRRVAFGSSGTIRYPDDPYDRLWSPEVLNSRMVVVSSNVTFGEFITLKDRVPPAVLKHAVTASRPNSSLEIFMGLPLVEVPIYWNGYFSEVDQLRPNQTRSFMMLMNNEPFSERIVPLYANTTFAQLYANNTRASANTTFSLVPLNDSTLPPLINAMEVFIRGDELTSSTDKKDVQGLASLKNAFAVLKVWSGDPCLPAPYTWDWIDCSTDPTPRVTALFLGSFGLSGLLPNFSSMDALQTIDLHNNSLQGPIPDSLGTLPALKILNLADNQFNGSVPSSLSSRKGLNLSVTGNHDLCTSGTSCPDLSKKPAKNSSANEETNILKVMFGVIIQSIIMLQFRGYLLL